MLISISVQVHFLNTDKMYFMDYKHFLGNQTPFITNDPVGSFRLLDYYKYSTSDKYFSGNFHYQFRKFLVTNIPLVRMAGIRENIFVNYLATPTSKNYTEVGYSIDGILRIFRLEGAAAFQDGKYLNYGFRIGITSNFTDFSITSIHRTIKAHNNGYIFEGIIFTSSNSCSNFAV